MPLVKAHVTLDNPTVTDWRRAARFWTVDRLWRMAEMLENGRTDAQIAVHFGVTVDAVMLARKRHSVTARTRIHSSARDVAVLLGIGCAKAVTTWIDRGWLRGRKLPYGSAGWYSITHEALLAFLENPEHHHRWRPERITEPVLRAWAVEIHIGPFLTVGEVARRLCVERGTVNTWIQTGRLPAYRHGNWWVRASDLDGFQVPSHIERQPRQWTPDEDARLLTMRAGGVHWNAIGRALNRWPSVACKRWHDLNETRRAA